MDATSSLSRALDERFTITREIGRGGTATVYLADDRKHGRQVAIKVLRAEIGASVGAERFLREIGIVARLTHPHILPLIDSGDADGSLYYVSPFVSGGSLRERLIAEGTLSLRESLHIAEGVGSALDYAHRNGFVHRDVKPENILFTDGHAVLADFGVARACSGARADMVTESGMAVGTPAYMSPEQAAADETIGSASDVYSLACVIYEMLAGVPPIVGRSARATLAKQVTETPLPLRSHRPEVPSGVDAALMRALLKNPDDRFASVNEFIAALLEGIEAPQRVTAVTSRSIAVLPFVNASSDAENEYLSDGITDELIDAFSKVAGLRVASRTSVFALKGNPQDIRTIGALLGVTEVLEGTVRKQGDRLRITAQLSSTQDGRLLWSQRYDRTLHDVFEIQDEIAQTIVSTLRATSYANLAEPTPRHATENVTAYGLYLRGRYAWNKRSQEGVLESIHYFEQAIAEDPSYALAYTGLSDAYALQIDYRSVPVAEGFGRAIAYARQALALDDSLAEAHASLAWSLFAYEWNWAEAEREFRRAIECNRRYATAHQWYGFFLASGGRLDEALIEGHTAQELDPSSVSIRRSVGWLYVYGRRYDQAKYHLNRAIEMNPTADETYRVLGLALALNGEFSEATRVLRDAVRFPDAGSYTTATLGFALGRAGERGEAQAILASLEEQSHREYVSPVALATVCIGLGEYERALDWAERAYDDRRGWLAYFGVNPLLDPLRGHARFQALLNKVARDDSPRRYGSSPIAE